MKKGKKEKIKKKEKRKKKKKQKEKKKGKKGKKQRKRKNRKKRREKQRKKKSRDVWVVCTLAPLPCLGASHLHSATRLFGRHPCSQLVSVTCVACACS